MPANTTASSGQKPGKSGRKKGRSARLIVIVLVLALIGGVGYGAFWSVSTVRASFPQTNGSIELDGLSGPVDVKRDGYGIPQIYADTDEDLFRAQGYVQAQDRFWEMDVRRHMTAGRLSEMFGEGQVETDEFLRTLGWRRVAQEEYDTKLSPETKKYLQAYADGVNAYLKGKRRRGPLRGVRGARLHQRLQAREVDPGRLGGLAQGDGLGPARQHAGRDRPLPDDQPPRPEADRRPVPAVPVRPEQADRRRAGEYDTDATERVRRRTAARTARHAGAAPAPAGTAPPAAPAQGLQSQLVARSPTTLDDVPALLGPNGNGIGSNSWVVSGDHTTTGKPLLANDPHLAPRCRPSGTRWACTASSVSGKCQYDVAGYTFSGMPGVIIGHNQDIAWGMTNLGADVTDLYLEKLTGDGYLYDGKVQALHHPRGDHQGRRRREPRRSPSARTNNGPLRLRPQTTSWRRSARRPPSTSAAPDRGDGYARRPALDRAGPRQLHGRRLRDEQGQGLRRLPQGGRRTSRSPRRT